MQKAIGNHPCRNGRQRQLSPYYRIAVAIKICHAPRQGRGQFAIWKGRPRCTKSRKCCRWTLRPQPRPWHCPKRPPGPGHDGLLGLLVQATPSLDSHTRSGNCSHPSLRTTSYMLRHLLRPSGDPRRPNPIRRGAFLQNRVACVFCPYDPIG